MNELDALYDLEKFDRALSYSRIVDFNKNGAEALVRVKKEIDSDGIRLGSLIDDLLLNKHNFNKIYLVFDGGKPIGNLAKLCNIILDNYIEIPSIEEMLELCKKNKLWPRWKDERILQELNSEEFWNYIHAKFDSKNKTIVSSEDLEFAKEVVEVLLTHENSSYIFNNNLEHYNQFKFTFEKSGFKIRGIIDKVLIDHKKKTVKFIDLKTGKDSCSKFITSLLKWRYDLQALIYTLAFPTFLKLTGLKGYKLLPFEFLYISRYERIPLVYETTKKWLKASKNGFTDTSGIKYKGLNELLEEIKWHINHNEFKLSKKIYESKGRLKLEDSFITLE